MGKWDDRRRDQMGVLNAGLLAAVVAALAFGAPLLGSNRMKEDPIAFNLTLWGLAMMGLSGFAGATVAFSRLVDFRAEADAERESRRGKPVPQGEAHTKNMRQLGYLTWSLLHVQFVLGMAGLLVVMLGLMHPR